MTYQSKAALREKITELQMRLTDATVTLENYGFKKRHEDPGFAGWYRPEREDLSRNARIAAAATAAARTETLELVLKALEIPGYTSFVYDDDTKRDPTTRETRYDTDRFRTDLGTALIVRAEKKQAEADAATEARVAGFAKKDSPMYASGGYTGSSGALFGHAYPGETIYSANDVRERGVKNLEYLSKLANATSKPQSETVEKTTKKSKGDKK